MGQKDPRVDDYIERSASFARPILKHLRRLVHTGCPQVEETIKWGFPHFEHQGMLCSMAAFKQHCTFGFWKGALLARPGRGRARARRLRDGPVRPHRRALGSAERPDRDRDHQAGGRP